LEKNEREVTEMDKKRKLLIEIGDERIEAELLWDKAPNFCKVLWDRMPFTGRVNMAKICSNELMIMAPFTMPAENTKEKPISGDIGWWDWRQCINLWYDDLGPLGPLGATACHFARVTKNLEGAARVGARNWAKAGEKVTFKKLEE
jgi:hypothetical protein